MSPSPDASPGTALVPGASSEPVEVLRLLGRPEADGALPKDPRVEQLSADAANAYTLLWPEERGVADKLFEALTAGGASPENLVIPPNYRLIEAAFRNLATNLDRLRDSLKIPGAKEAVETTMRNMIADFLIQNASTLQLLGIVSSCRPTVEAALGHAQVQKLDETMHVHDVAALVRRECVTERERMVGHFREVERLLNHRILALLRERLPEESPHKKGLYAKTEAAEIPCSCSQSDVSDLMRAIRSILDEYHLKGIATIVELRPSRESSAAHIVQVRIPYFRRFTEWLGEGSGFTAERIERLLEADTRAGQAAALERGRGPKRGTP